MPDEAAGPGDASKGAEGNPSIRHFGDIWHALQCVAREDDPRFENVSAVQHSSASAEGLRDVERWLSILERRRDPARSIVFPPGSISYRGFRIARRTWPEGVFWEAYAERSGLKAALPRAAGEEEMKRSCDLAIDAETRMPPSES
jgi:hypothetical protein